MITKLCELYIRERTLYVGLTGTFRMLIEKSKVTVPLFLRLDLLLFFFLGLKQSSGYMEATMNK